MSLTIKKTMTDLWITRGDLDYYVTRLEEADKRTEAKALAEAGYAIGRALIDLENLLERDAGAIKAAIEKLEGKS